MKKISSAIRSIKDRKFYKYCVRKQVFQNGRTVFTPMMKYPGVFTSWQQIVRIVGYQEVFLMDVSGEQNLTYEECLTHIALFKEQLLNQEEIKFQIIYDEV